MKSIQEFKTFENANIEPKVQDMINKFKADPQKYLIDLEALNSLSEDELVQFTKNYLDFPFRVPRREDDPFYVPSPISSVGR